MSYTGPHSQLNQIVLSDTLNEWREKNNQQVDILNNLKMYDVVAGDGIATTSASISLGGTSTLSIDLDGSSLALSASGLSIATGGVQQSHLANDSVGSAQIANNAVGTTELASDCVQSSKIAAF